jgi:hypothetical protein
LNVNAIIRTSRLTIILRLIFAYLLFSIREHHVRTGSIR